MASPQFKGVLSFLDNNSPASTPTIFDEESLAIAEVFYRFLKLVRVDVLSTALNTVVERTYPQAELEAYINNLYLKIKGFALEKALRLITENATEKLRLRAGLVDNEGLQAIVEALKKNTSIKRMDFGQNNINDEGAEIIAGLITETSSLVSIGLCCNRISDKGMIVLATALEQNQSVRDFSVGSNQIGNAGAIALANTMKLNKNLVHLNLFNNKIGDLGAIALIDALGSYPSCTWMLLSNNSQITDRSALRLISMLKNNTVLERINLQCTKIGMTNHLQEAIDKENLPYTVIVYQGDFAGIKKGRACEKQDTSLPEPRAHSQQNRQNVTTAGDFLSEVFGGPSNWFKKASGAENGKGQPLAPGKGNN